METNSTRTEEDGGSTPPAGGCTVDQSSLFWSNGDSGQGGTVRRGGRSAGKETWAMEARQLFFSIRATETLSCYVELAAEAQHRGWNAEVRPMEVGYRGFVARSTTRQTWESEARTSAQPSKLHRRQSKEGSPALALSSKPGGMRSALA